MIRARLGNDTFHTAWVVTPDFSESSGFLKTFGTGYFLFLDRHMILLFEMPTAAVHHGEQNLRHYTIVTFCVNNKQPDLTVNDRLI